MDPSFSILPYFCDIIPIRKPWESMTTESAGLFFGNVIGGHSF
jgi:hypothetical protein